MEHKETTGVSSYLRIFWFICMSIGVCFTPSAWATTQTITLQTKGLTTSCGDATFTSSDDFTITATWDNFACQGSPVTVTYTVTLNTVSQFPGEMTSLEGFVPTAGFACPTVIPPLSGSFTPGGFFDDTMPTQDNVCNNGCPDCGNGIGVWSFANPYPLLITFEMQVTAIVTDCGNGNYEALVYAFRRQMVRGR